MRSFTHTLKRREEATLTCSTACSVLKSSKRMVSFQWSRLVHRSSIPSSLRAAFTNIFSALSCAASVSSLRCDGFPIVDRIE